MNAAQPAVMVARSSNSPLQPDHASNNSAGTVAVTPPNAPSMKIQPLTSATRSLGNQRTLALTPAARAAATPNPISARARTSSPNSFDQLNSAAPVAATSSNALWTRRGP